MDEIKRLLRLKSKAEANNQIRELGNFCNSLGIHYQSIGKLHEALREHQEEFIICESLNDPNGIAIAHRRLSEVKI